MAAKKQTAASTPLIMACCDTQRRTCLQVDRVNGYVKYIPLDVGEGLLVQQASADAFDDRYQPMVNYPIEKAAQLYLSYSQNIGATKEALDYLGQVIKVTKQEFDMATKRQVTKADVAEEKRTTARRTANGVEAPVKAGRRAVDPVVKPTKAAPAAKVKAEPKAKVGEKKVSAAQMFQDLIMEGKLTDDQIFAKVQETYGLDEKKRGYVKWYRNHLTKQGKNPPAAKVAK